VADRTHDQCRFYEAFGGASSPIGTCEWRARPMCRPPWFDERWCDRIVTAAEATNCPCFEARKDETPHA